MATDESKKSILMSAVSTPSAESPALRLPVSKRKLEEPQTAPAPETAANYKSMLKAGRKADRVVGDILVEEETVKSTFALKRSEHNDFKVLCAMKNVKMGELVRDAILGFIEENKDLLKKENKDPLKKD